MIDIDDKCIAHYQKMVEFHQAELERWSQMLNNVTESTEAAIVDVTIASTDDKELSVEDDQPVCPGCVQRDAPVCASQVVDSVEQTRTFFNEECMKQTNCDEQQSWAIISTGICEVSSFS